MRIGQHLSVLHQLLLPFEILQDGYPALHLGYDNEFGGFPSLIALLPDWQRHCATQTFVHRGHWFGYVFSASVQVLIPQMDLKASSSLWKSLSKLEPFEKTGAAPVLFHFRSHATGESKGHH